MDLLLSLALTALIVIYAWYAPPPAFMRGYLARRKREQQELDRVLERLQEIQRGTIDPSEAEMEELMAELSHMAGKELARPPAGWKEVKDSIRRSDESGLSGILNALRKRQP